MHLVEIKETKDEGTSPSRPATRVYAPQGNNLSSATPRRVRKGQHLDVDGILARSLPNLGASSAIEVKGIVLR